MMALRVQGPGKGGAVRPGARRTFEVFPLRDPAAKGTRMTLGKFRADQ